MTYGIPFCLNEATAPNGSYPFVPAKAGAQTWIPAYAGMNGIIFERHQRRGVARFLLLNVRDGIRLRVLRASACPIPARAVRRSGARVVFRASVAAPNQ